MSLRVQPSDPALRAFFNPANIAIIGASGDETKIGGRPIRNLRLGGFPGAILPINPGRDTVQGLRAHPKLSDVDGPVDLVIICVPAAQVAAAVEDCAAKGVRAAIIYSSGFAEVDPAGAAEQAKIVATAARAGMRLLGPNCMGTINASIGLLGTFTSVIVNDAPPAGRISIASQSGAFGSHCLALMRKAGLGVNLWATTGNQCDVEVGDFLEYMAADPGTDTVIGSIEGVHDARSLIRAFEIARANRKPVIIMKVGRSEAGAAAMSSHTASLAGSDAVFDAVLRRYGVHRARSIDELMDVAYACSLGRFPTSRRLGIVTVSGGVGVLMADAAADVDLDVAPLPEDAQQRMKALVPFAGTRNPLDVTAQILANPGLIEPMFSTLITDGGYGSVIAFLSHLGLNPQVVAGLFPGLTRVAERYGDRFLAVSVLAHPDTRAALEKMGYAVFEDPTRAIVAIDALARFAEAFETTPKPVALASDMPRVIPGTTYSEHEAKALLRTVGVPVPDERVAESAAAAADAAQAIGFPVVLKILSPDIVHKSEIGGVLLNVQDHAAAAAGYDLLRARAAAAAPDARIDGVLVAPMITDGIETVLGVVRDPVFGPVVMFGLGGIFVEILRDVVFRPAPFGLDEAQAMIDAVKGSALLKGARGKPRADLDALATALARLSQFAAANADTLAAVDINPFLVLSEGRGALAADAVIETVPHDPNEVTPTA